jgi:hypothetical protein
MVNLGRRHQDKGPPAGSDEDPVVRQYRFLLRNAAPEAVADAHIEAMARLSQEQRDLVLRSIQRGLLAGQRLSSEDISKMARLIVLGERRSPNAFISACEPVVLLGLSNAVIHAEACFGLFGQYASWDGADPAPEDDAEWASGGFNPDSGRWNVARATGRDDSGIVHGAGGGWGGGDGGGAG